MLYKIYQKTNFLILAASHYRFSGSNTAACSVFLRTVKGGNCRFPSPSFDKDTFPYVATDFRLSQFTACICKIRL